MKKKVITGLLALTMVAGTLAGCGSTASSGNSSAGSLVFGGKIWEKAE